MEAQSLIPRGRGSRGRGRGFRRLQPTIVSCLLLLVEYWYIVHTSANSPGVGMRIMRYAINYVHKV